MESRVRPKASPGPWHMYVVECSDHTLYVGIARDVDARVATHNAGRGARYTRTRRPVRLVYRETWPDLRSAMRREREVKGWSRPAKVERLRLAGVSKVRSETSCGSVDMRRGEGGSPAGCVREAPPRSVRKTSSTRAA